MIYLIKFYQNNKMMKELQIESDRMETATKEAIDTIQGYIYWNRIRVETL
jgi:hypothetical protein